MNNQNIAKRVLKIESQIEQLEAKLRSIQEDCPQDDHYWVEFYCPDCKKFWKEG